MALLLALNLGKLLKSVPGVSICKTGGWVAVPSLLGRVRLGWNPGGKVLRWWQVQRAELGDPTL